LAFVFCQQQPSPSIADAIATCVQATLQFTSLPVRTSSVHGSPSPQSCGHGVALDGSHVSPAALSTTPSPHRAEQSLSVCSVQPLGQQPSPAVHALITFVSHTRLHASGVPDADTRMHALLAGHLGQLSGGSQVSPGSVTPLPHTGAQSSSFDAFAPLGQHWSPAIRAVIFMGSQRASHSLPTSCIGSQASLDVSQLSGHAPALPAGIAVSQRSPPFTLPSPHAVTSPEKSPASTAESAVPGVSPASPASGESDPDVSIIVASFPPASVDSARTLLRSLERELDTYARSNADFGEVQP
jgi:hypothetical protein